MSARSIGVVLGGPERKDRARTGQPVRHSSYHYGEREARWYQPIERRTIGARIRAAKVYDRTHKEPGKKNGPIGHVGIEVLEFMHGLIGRKTGQLDPSIDFMMKKLRRSRDAIVRALAALKRHGFLDWIRRTVPVDDPGERGPQVKQISNAYRLDLPARVKALMALILRGSPIPDDQLQRAADDKQNVEDMLATATASEVAGFRIADPELRAAFERLGGAVERSNASPNDGLNADR